MAKVQFYNVSFSYGDKKIIQNLSLEVNDGEIMGVIGPSGCGKTTLIRLLCGFIKPETGSIYIGETCVFDAEKRINIPPERRNIGVVFQDYAVWPHLTVLENVKYPLKKKRMDKKQMQEIAMNALKQVQMETYANHLPSQLSGGQQQRVAIARALVSSKKLIVLDEPITNLDLKLRQEMLKEIREIQKTIGTTIVYISHDQEASLELCDRLAIMDQQGNIRQLGNDYDIVMKPKDRYIFEFVGISNFVDVVAKEDGVYINAQNGLVKLDDKSALKNPTKVYQLAFRPMDAVFDNESPIKGKVVTETFLGNITNYFIQLGDKQIRLQQSALDVMKYGKAKEGQEVGLKFVRKFYYEKEEA